MSYDPRFGPAAQTPVQRANVLRQLLTTYPKLGAATPALAQQLFASYVAGELSWCDVRRALDGATPEQAPKPLRMGA
ncbi:hypothetical protein [Hymenobacter rubidus]|uniref:hypothetical protein n=1 Tax=Hymenobacter rubidus TaxID=1441626 RepID=UPI00191FCB94|nr:hypothetical protein [Hymenobacter rubidus]